MTIYFVYIKDHKSFVSTEALPNVFQASVSLDRRAAQRVCDMNNNLFKFLKIEKHLEKKEQFIVPSDATIPNTTPEVLFNGILEDYSNLPLDFNLYNKADSVYVGIEKPDGKFLILKY
jgi:hypothetical protein